MNTIVHFELPAGDSARAKGFWSGVFGWTFREWQGPIEYHMLDGAEPGGAIYPSEAAERGPIVYFATDDIGATIAKIRELGGSADDKQPIPTIGWYARCRDTEGNDFSLFQGDESAPG